MFDATAGQVPIGRSHRSKINAYSNNCYFILLIESYWSNASPKYGLIFIDYAYLKPSINDWEILVKVPPLNRVGPSLGIFFSLIRMAF